MEQHECNDACFFSHNQRRVRHKRHTIIREPQHATTRANMAGHQATPSTYALAGSIALLPYLYLLDIIVTSRRLITNRLRPAHSSIPYQRVVRRLIQVSASNKLLRAAHKLIAPQPDRATNGHVMPHLPATYADARPYRTPPIFIIAPPLTAPTLPAPRAFPAAPCDPNRLWSRFPNHPQPHLCRARCGRSPQPPAR